MKLPENYKKTEIGIIPNNWQVEKLENLCQPNGLVRGPFGSTLKKEYFVNSGYKVYEQKNAINKDANIGNYYIDQRKYEELSRFQVIPGDFIISCSGTIGKIYKLPENIEEGVINQALLKISIDDKKISDEFFYHYFDWSKFQERITENTQGGAMQNLIGMDEFRQIGFSVPPINEQRFIAEVLSDVDALIEAQEALIEKKRLIKQGVMQELLTEKRRLPGFTKEWKRISLKALEKQGTISLSRGNVISKKDIKNFPGNYPIYSSSIMNDGLFGRYGKYMFDKEMITWSVDGGGHFFYRPKNKFSVTNVSGIIQVEDKSAIDCRFFAYQLQLLHSRLFFDYTRKAHPSVIRELYDVLIPELTEQIEISQIINDIDTEINFLNKKIDKTRLIKQGMMQELLTGRTRLV